MVPKSEDDDSDEERDDLDDESPVEDGDDELRDEVDLECLLRDDADLERRLRDLLSSSASLKSTDLDLVLEAAGVAGGAIWAAIVCEPSLEVEAARGA